MPHLETSTAAPRGWRIAGGILLLLGTLAVAISCLMARIGAEQAWVLAAWLLGLASLPLGLNFGVRDPLHLALPRPDRELAAVLGILVVAVVLRAQGVQSWAEGDQAGETLLATRQALNAVGSPFSRDPGGVPFLFYLPALSFFRLTGEPASAAVWGAAAESLVSLLLLHLVLRRLIPIPWAAGVTLVAALIPWQVALDHIGFVQLQAVTWTLVLLYMFLRALDSGRPIEYLLAGYAGGACLLVYPPAAVGPVLAVLILAARRASGTDFSGQYFRGLAISVVGTLAVVAPLVP